MKKTAIIKASLASLVIGTGLFTSTAQASEISILRHTLGLDEQSKQTQQVAPESKVDSKLLLDYYNQTPRELTNQIGHTNGNNQLVFITSNAGQTTVSLSPTKYNEFKTGDEGNSGLDIFIVKENATDRSADEFSIGGVTKTDNNKYIDTLKNVNVNVKTTENGATLQTPLSGISFNKKEVSLKELDFKLRKALIDQKGLYKDYTKGSIKVTTNQGYNTFELHKKLQDNRMSDVINSTDIKHIEVTLTK